MNNPHEVYVPSTAEEFDDCVGKKDPNEAHGNLSAFLGEEESFTPENVQEYWLKKDQSNWKQQWVDMPESDSYTVHPFKKIDVKFKTEEDFLKFCEITGCKLTTKTKSTWFPFKEVEVNMLSRWIEDEDA